MSAMCQKRTLPDSRLLATAGHTLRLNTHRQIKRLGFANAAMRSSDVGRSGSSGSLAEWDVFLSLWVQFFHFHGWRASIIAHLWIPRTWRIEPIRNIGCVALRFVCYRICEAALANPRCVLCIVQVI